MTLLAKRTLEVEKTRSVPGAAIQYITSPPLFFSDGSYVVSSDIRTRGRAGHWLHTITEDGKLDRSFGERGIDLLTRSGDASFWAANFDSYRIEKWSKEGTLASVVERRAHGFPLPDTTIQRPKVGDRVPRIAGIREDAEGRLWVRIFIRTRQEVEVRDREGRPIKLWGMDPDPKATATVIEVLDPKSGEVIATKRFPGMQLWPNLDGGPHYQAQRTTEMGLLLYDVGVLRLTGADR